VVSESQTLNDPFQPTHVPGSADMADQGPVGAVRHGERVDHRS
jgi:hypothetical protein